MTISHRFNRTDSQITEDNDLARAVRPLPGRWLTVLAIALPVMIGAAVRLWP